MTSELSQGTMSRRTLLMGAAMSSAWQAFAKETSESAPGAETTEQSSAAGASSGSQTGGEDNVIDAEYVDVDENK